MPSNNLNSGSPHVVLIAEMIKSAVNNINTIIPGKVTEYNSTTGRAKIQPMNKLILNQINEEGINESLEIPAVDNVPVCFFGSPKVRMTHSVKVGDTGLLLVCQRSADEFKTAQLSQAESPGALQPFAPKDYRKFDINDAMFFPVYFSGDKGFQGIQAPTGEDISLKSKEVELGAAGGKAQVKGPGGENLSKSLKSLHDRVDKVEGSVKQVASTNYFNAPSLPTVIGNSIFGAILGRISQLFMNRAYAPSSPSSELLGQLARKALKITNTGFEYAPAAPDNTDAAQISVGIEAAVSHAELITSPVNSTVFQVVGWIMPGTNELITGRTPNPIFTGKSFGSADFSIMSKFDPWNKLIGFYIQRVNANTTYLSLVWPPGTSDEGINQVGRIIISMEEITDEHLGQSIPYNDPPYIVGDFYLTGSLANIPNPHASADTRNINTLNLPGLYLRNQVVGDVDDVIQAKASFFSQQLIRPVMFVYFYGPDGVTRLALKGTDFL